MGEHGIRIRPGTAADLPELTRIYNHYVVTSHATFDLTPFTETQRRDWLAHYAGTGPHRVLVAESATGLVGYTTSSRFRDKAAYTTSVETTVYTRPEAAGQGIGGVLYAALIEVLSHEDVHRAYAGVALPNDASLALHAKFGFAEVGVFREVGRKFDTWWDVCWLEREFP